MYFLIYIAWGFLGMQLFNVFLNLVFRQRIPKTTVKNTELISVLIPARNEESTIGILLDALHAINNEFLEIVVYNDDSTDRTLEIVQHYAQRDTRVRMAHTQPLPEGWLGKNHACYRLAQEAKGRYLVFVDADVKLCGNVVVDAVLYMKKYRLGLLSVFPKQIQRSIGEKFTVPIMNYILLTLLPLVFVRVSPFKSHSAANGQFMVFDAEHYSNLQPHKKYKSSAVEDIHIATYFKRSSVKTACLNGEDRIQCRMYTSYKHAVNGFSKNVFMFFGNSPILAFLFWICATFGFVPIWIFEPKLLFAYFFGVILVQVLYSYSCKQNPFTAILFFPVQLIALFQVLVLALIVKMNKNYTWKGRNIF